MINAPSILSFIHGYHSIRRIREWGITFSTWNLSRWDNSLFITSLVGASFHKTNKKRGLTSSSIELIICTVRHLRAGNSIPLRRLPLERECISF